MFHCLFVSEFVGTLWPSSTISSGDRDLYSITNTDNDASMMWRDAT